MPPRKTNVSEGLKDKQVEALACRIVKLEEHVLLLSNVIKGLAGDLTMRLGYPEHLRQIIWSDLNSIKE